MSAPDITGAAQLTVGHGTSWTPAPWGCEYADGDWLITYGLDLHHGPRALGKVFDYAGEFQEADARLISAAPDYAAAAQEAIAAIEALTGTIPQEQLDALMSAYGSLRRASAKARGQ